MFEGWFVKHSQKRLRLIPGLQTLVLRCNRYTESFYPPLDNFLNRKMDLEHAH